MARLKTIPSRLTAPTPARREVSDSWRTDKTSSTARGYGYKWQQARAGYLAKHPHCVMCLAELGMMDLSPAEVVVSCAQRDVAEPLATVVDHQFAHKGDPAVFWDSSRWQSLCATHHNRDAQRRDNGSQRHAVGLDGWPMED